MIDGHAHACGALLTAEGIRKYLKRYQLERIVLCGGEAGSKRNYLYPLFSDVVKEDQVDRFVNGMITTAISICGFANHFDQENERVWQLSQELPEQVWNAYWANPLEENCLEKMKQFYREKGLAMVKLHQCWTDFDIDSKMSNQIFAWAAREDLPVFIHLKNTSQASRFANMANRNQDTKFIVAHLLWAGLIAAVLRHNNVWFDLSSPQLYSVDTMHFALKNYGAARLILGSDMPYGMRNIDVILRRLDKLNLTDGQIDQITRENIWGLLLKG